MKDTHTPHHPIRVEEELWETFGQLAGKRNRAETIREFIRWYVGEPDAVLPARPGTEESDPSAGAAGLRSELRRALAEFNHSPAQMALSVDKDEALSSLELQLLSLAADGLSDAELGEFLGVSSRTAGMRVKKLAAKVQAAGGVKVWVPKIPGKRAVGG
ncbi:hypothetical protein [Streptosporangium sp. NPDC002721]|uniref:hypothetical protein n=1 Tax=Streptosporangium sp. NPDC002721 TaxID=3366188 RepID=UPI00367A4EFA